MPKVEHEMKIHDILAMLGFTKKPERYEPNDDIYRYRRVNAESFFDKYVGVIPWDLFLKFEKQLDSGEKTVLVSEDTIAMLEQKRKERQAFNDALAKCVRLNNDGIAYEKEGDIEGAIMCYEENIRGTYPATHSYERLMVFYRRQKDYDNEIRVIHRAIEVFSSENERRAALAIERHPEREQDIRDALVTCIGVKEMRSDNPEDGYKYIFSPYDVAKYRKRLEKALYLQERASVRVEKKPQAY